MKKVVVNRRYGGFGLSIKAEKRYAQLAGFDLNYYKQTKYKHRDGKDLFSRVDEPSDDEWLLFALKEDLGPSFDEFPDDGVYWHDRDLDRDDPLLVQVVEELGESANGDHAKLEVIEIPDGVDWTIEEYDGREWIAEAHRRWS